LSLAFVAASACVAGCGGEPAPVVDVGTKGGEPGSLPAPEKSKVAITKPAK
jgi:hypothetical protein